MAKYDVITCNSNPIEFVSKCTYMGVVFQTKGTLTGHFDHLRNKGINRCLCQCGCSHIPSYILELPLDLNVNIHNHNTRGHTKIHANAVIHEFAKRCLRYNIIKTLNNSPSSVINKITTHSLGGFITYIKVQLLPKYDYQCMLSNCYVCLNEV